MKKNILFGMIFLISIFYFLSDSFAIDIGGQGAEITVTDAYVSKYIWRGQDLYADNDGAHQPSIDIAFPALLDEVDVFLNVWGSFPLNKGHEDGEELDYTLTLSRDLKEAFNISAGYTYFDFPNTTSKSDVQEPWSSFTLLKIPYLPVDVSWTIWLGYDFQATSGGPDEGWYYSWGFDTELPLPKLAILQEDQTLGLGVVNWGNDGVADLKPNALYATEISLSTSYAFGSLNITPSFHYAINHEKQINSGDDEVWGGIEVSYAF